MKKYTIKDNLGNKKTIYAKDLVHALRLNDDDYLGLVKINGRTMYLRHHKSAVGSEWWGITPDKWGDNPKKKFKSKTELDKYLESVGATTDSKTKDEANLPTTIQALVNDEEAAIKAYEVAIKNLEGKIDDTAKQVLINIMKDERRHVENLYAILNGQVTEKNLEDSIHDAEWSNDWASLDDLGIDDRDKKAVEAYFKKLASKYGVAYVRTVYGMYPSPIFRGDRKKLEKLILKEYAGNDRSVAEEEYEFIEGK